MKDKIRKLAEEHGFVHEYMTIGERNDALTKYQEFAELIIQECCDIIEEDGSAVLPLIIKKHFGITE